MSNRTSWRVGVIRIMRFTSVMAIVLWTASGWAQTGAQADFTSLITLKVDARSEPAKVTTEEESALTSKGYVKIGTIRAAQPGKKTSAEATAGLRAAALSKAAGAGGDVVRFESEGVVGTAEVPTGKMKKVCEGSQQVSVSQFVSAPCNSDGTGLHCPAGHSETKYVSKCVRWGSVEQKKRVKSTDSEGTVWRYDPKLAADIAAAREAARKAEADAKVDDTPLFRAVDNGDRDAVEQLLAHGADVNAKDDSGETPLHEAVSGKHQDVVDLLRQHGGHE